MENEISGNECVPKKRERKKQLYKTILSQMEFYFSASNLSKDRWLNQKLNEENAIHLTEFLKFNKIRALTQTVEDLAKALKNSIILTVTEDMKVKRSQPINYKENEDDYIIYIEQVPSDADHEWLNSLFARYGKIDYISLPKFRNSGKCKGFAFIEFSEVESAEKAIQSYKKNGNYLSIDIEPAELMSIATYEEPSKEEPLANSDLNVKNVPEISAIASQVETDNNDRIIKKRKISDTYEELDKKKQKINKSLNEKTEENSELEEVTVNDSEKDGENGSEKDGGNVINTETDEGNIDESKKKKNRKKKSKKKKNRDDTDEHTGLQILSKKDWKRLRNKYLNMQKEKMKQLKKHIFLAKKRTGSGSQNGVFKKNEKSIEYETSKEIEKTKKTGNYSFSHGLIVKVKFNEPTVEVKELKNDMKKNQGLLFVDVKEGETVMYLRFSSSEAASDFCKNSSWPKTKILKGEKEMAYWNKIQDRREEKLSKNVKKKERGKDKLMRKAENILGKHITFD